MFYRLFGWWVRWQACRLAAMTMQGTQFEGERTLAPLLWSCTVFFENYICEGAEGTADDFGPKEPAVLKPVGKVGTDG